MVKLPYGAHLAIMKRIRGGTDPFGLTPVQLSNDGHVVGVVNRAAHGLDASTAARIAAHLASMRADEASHADERHLRTDGGSLDRLSAELLAHLGVDPLIVDWAAWISLGLSLQHDHANMGGYVCVDTPPGGEGTTTNLHMSPGVLWHGEGSIAIEGASLPDTVSAACAGMPLRRVFTHPVFDRHDLTIREVSHVNDHLWLVLDADMRALTPEQLIAIAPHGVRPSRDPGNGMAS
jgi:hypothetical protein